MNAIELSIVVLCYRSGDSIRDFAKKVEHIANKLTSSYEIIFVGNYIEGSTDRTEKILQDLVKDNPRYTAVCKPKKGMMGWDMRSGLEAAAGHYLCIIDGDGQFPIESIERCFVEIKSGKYDLVKTYRMKRDDGFYRKLISKTYNIIFRMLFPSLGSRDINSKPKMFTRKAYEHMDLRSDDWFIDAEIMLMVRKYGMSYFEFPVSFQALSGRSSFITMASICEFMKNLLIYRIKSFKNIHHDK